MSGTFGPYSPVYQAGSFFFVSGQVGADADKKAGADVKKQTEVALQNLTGALAEYGLSLADVVKTTIFVKNMRDFEVINAIYVEHFPEPRPARSCVEVSSLPSVADNELLIEIEAIAYKEPAA